MKTSSYPVRLPFVPAPMAHRTCGGGAQGSALVEMAVCLSILLVLVFALMDLSLGLYSYHYISAAAREGTRYAMVRGSSCTSWAAACPASAPDIQNYVRGLGYPGINPAAMTVTTAWPTTGISCSPSVTPCNNPGNLVQVTVQYLYPLSIPFLRSGQLNMTSTSAMVISQ